MTTTGESRGRRALAALAGMARGSARPPTPAQLDSGLAALRSRMNAGQGPQSAGRSSIVRWSLVGTLAATAALVAVGVVRSGRSRVPAVSELPALTYRVEGGSLVDGGYLRESGRGGIKVFFAEGTEFILKPGTRSRLRAVDASGARIAIEHGAASFLVTPAPATDRRWQVDVGPFLVTVKGTVFTVSWDAATETFELKLRHGRVTVSGPVTGGEIALRAGQRLLGRPPPGRDGDQRTEARRVARLLGQSRDARGGTARGATVRGVRQACRAGGQARLDFASGQAGRRIAGGPGRWPPGISTSSSPRPSTPV